MAAIGYKAQTLMDLAKFESIKTQKIAEVLTLRNEILNDIPYSVFNEGQYHKEFIRSYIPTPTRRMINEATQPQPTKIVERTFVEDKFESTSRIDEDAAVRGRGVNFNRFVMAQGHLAGMANEHGRTVFYGTPATETQKADGLATIYGSLTGETKSQIVNASAGLAAPDDSQYTSIYVVNWGDNFFGGFPQGTKAGIEHIDRSKGGTIKIEGTDRTGAAGSFYGYEETFKLRHSLIPKDFRYGGRVANIRVPDLKTGNAADLIDLLIDVQECLWEQNGGIAYVHPVLHSILRKQVRDEIKGGGGLTYENYYGKKVLMFGDMPIRRAESISLNEGLVD